MFIVTIFIFICLFNDALNTFYLRLYGLHLFNDTLNTFSPRVFCAVTKMPETEYSLYQLCGRKEGIVLFNDALNTFYLRLYGVRHMVKDH